MDFPVVKECASHVCMLSQVWLCNSMDVQPPGSSVHGILQARILEWVATPTGRKSIWLQEPPPGDLPDLGIEPASPALAGRFFTTAQPGKPGVKNSPANAVDKSSIPGLGRSHVVRGN